MIIQKKKKEKKKKKKTVRIISLFETAQATTGGARDFLVRGPGSFTERYRCNKIETFVSILYIRLITLIFRAVARSDSASSCCLSYSDFLFERKFVKSFRHAHAHIRTHTHMERHVYRTRKYILVCIPKRS